MFQYTVKNDSHPASVDFLDQPHGIIHRPIFRGNGGVVRDVVTEVSLWRCKKRGDPYRFKTQPLDVIKLLEDALKVADPVSITVIKGTWIDLVDCSFMEPWQGSHCVTFHYTPLGHKLRIFTLREAQFPWHRPPGQVCDRGHYIL